MKPIVWIASYPKSGNTWFRIFLTNYLRDAAQPASINAIDGGPIASDRQTFDEAVGYESADLTPDEIDALRPEVYRHLAGRAERILYCKVHDACTLLPDGRPMFPPEATEAVIYLVRNPLDVAVSCGHHLGRPDYDKQVRNLADRNHAVSKWEGREGQQLRQRLLSWSEHVASWLEAPGMRVHPIRYEDLKRRPEETFAAAMRFLGFAADPARLAKAVAFSRFEELQRQEQELDFHERPRASRAFFRRGEIGSWREELSPEQVARIVADHGSMMRRFGYLDAAGGPVF